MSSTPQRAVLVLLTAQALAFGVSLALLIIPANSLFLSAYGAKWLPVTYIAIAVFGSGVSALVARAARRTRLVRVATATLLTLAVLYAAFWLILVAGGVWASAPLLVLFPVALQLGFVFIGGQAGRLLDVRQLKEKFPRIVTGFAAGFLVGGVLGLPLLSLLGSTEHLLVAATVVQLAFLSVLLTTERRFPEVRAAPATSSSAVPRRPARALFASRLVLLLLVYQLLSSMGAQVVDFILFNRAAAHFTGNDLTRFLSGYTAVLNLVDILFLALVAGVLMRRFGLRLGLVLNPVVVTGLLVINAVLIAGPGAATLGVFVLAGVTQTLNIALTDGTTRTSVNAAFQIVPIEDRLAAQAVVEGIGVPVAIGATGAVLLVMNVLGLGIGAVIAFGVALSLIWTASGVAMYRSYRRALGDEMSRRSLVAYEIDEDDVALQALLNSDDARDVRLGLDLLPRVVSAPSAEALRQASDHEDPEVRVRALIQLAAHGDARARAEAGRLAAELALSTDTADRCAAAVALGSRDVVTAPRSILVALLDDPEPAVRAAALEAVAPEDAGEQEVVRRVVAALEEPRTARSASTALRRVGDAAVPLLADALTRDGAARRLQLVRAAANAAAEHGPAVIEPALRDRDRVVVLAALDALAAADRTDIVPPDLLDDLFDDAVAHAARSLAARRSPAASDGSLRRALEDETELARRLVIAVLALRHGDRVRDAVRVVDGAEGQRRALGIEALDVLLSRDEAAMALPIVRRDLTSDEQGVALRQVESSARGPEGWIAEMAEDPEGVWRSSWLALCARHASAP